MTDLKVVCPSCSALLRLANPSLAGKKIRCPKCKNVVTVPDDAESMAITSAEDPKPSGNLATSLMVPFILFLILLIVGGLGAYFALEWYNQQHAARPINPDPPTYKAKPDNGPEHPDRPVADGKLKGFQTPDAVLDAYVKALREGNVSACQATMTRERLKNDKDYIIGTRLKDKAITPEAVDNEFLDLMKFYNGAEWKEGEFKRFPAEIDHDSDDKVATIICVYQNHAKGKNDRFRRYVFLKDHNGWLQHNWEDHDAKELDKTKYPYTWNNAKAPNND